MEIIEDSGKYDQLQFKMMQALISSIVEGIESGKIEGQVVIPEECLENLVESIAFNVASLLDGSRTIENETKVNLTFDDGAQIIGVSGGSYIHEMIMGYIDENGIEGI